MKTNDEFDRIMSDALSEYREAEPLAGLEDRVLRRVQQQSGRQRLWWRWSFAAGLAVALLAVAAWIELRRSSLPPADRANDSSAGDARTRYSRKFR